MTRSLLGLIATVAVLSATPASAQQGSPATTPTGVSRIVLIRILPGESEAFWADVRQHLKPIYEEEKRQGILVNYGFETKVTTDHENDWSLAISLTYKNWAALDDAAARTEPITLAHYGSAQRRTDAVAARGTHARIVQSFLLRNVTVNDWH